jgi:hypothetical protein
MARMYRKNFIQSEGTVKYEFSTTIFGGWDFAIFGKYTDFEKSATKTKLIVCF